MSFFRHSLVGKAIDSVYVDTELTYLMLNDGTQVTIRGFVCVEHASRPGIGVGSELNSSDRSLMRVTAETIHDELQRLGHDARLEKGDGYFYFAGPTTTDWLHRIVKAPALSSLTLEQWLAEFNQLAKLNQEIQHGRVSPKPRSLRRPNGRKRNRSPLGSSG